MSNLKVRKIFYVIMSSDLQQLKRKANELVTPLVLVYAKTIEARKEA